MDYASTMLRLSRVASLSGQEQALCIDLPTKRVPGGIEALERYENDGRNTMYSHIEHQCEYYFDGKRTCGEIIDMTRRECYGKSTDEGLYQYIETLVALQLADFIN